MGSRKQCCRQNLHPTKSKMAAAAILKFCFNGHNSAIFAHICTKFCTTTQNHVPETDLPSHLTFDKSKMVAAAILKFTLTAITWPLLHIFPPNLMRTLEMTPTKSFNVKICIRQNTRWRQPPFWNFALTAITRPFLHIFARNFASGLKITFRKQICRQFDFRQNPRWRRRRKWCVKRHTCQT